MRNRSTLLLALILTAACSTNPATGKKEFNIVSEQQELAIGQQSHEQVVKQFGIYDEKPELSRLVNEIGQRIASTSERPQLPWRFTVLDTPMINAMALPGGYIYITRGMLEQINSEDELAGVLGHEIAHVTARHSAQQISRSQLAQLGMVIGAVAAGPQAAQAYGQLAELGVALLFQRYSRAQESQADLLGTGYIAEASYNPQGAERMLMALQRLSRNDTSGLERYFQSHPDPAKRVQDVRKKVQELASSGATFPPPQRDAYVKLLDGSITGNSTENMVIRDRTMYDRAHGMIIPLPSGWSGTAAPGMLFAMTPAREGTGAAFYAQEVDARELQGANARDAVRNRIQQMNLRYVGSRETATASGDRFPIDVWQGQTQQGTVGVETTQFVHGDHVAVFIFVSPSVSSNNSPLAEVMRRATIDVARARSVEPPRMKIGTVRNGESWADLAQRATGNANDARAIANMNGYELDTRPPSGLTVKLPQDVVRE
jgi:predicted Zn-dependent protease